MAGLKTGSLFTCPKEDRAELLAGIRALNARLVPKGLRILPVKTVGDRELLYLYRPARLRRESDFPHEVGLFLGYPPRDVEGFIREKARRAKCTGAWKVYGDEEAARKGGFFALGPAWDEPGESLDSGCNFPRLGVYLKKYQTGRIPEAARRLGRGFMRELFRTMVYHLEAGEPVILVSLLSSSGSTPRGAGAMMACFPGGSTGTIGGGNVEFTAQKLAQELLQSRENALRSYRFTPGDAASLGMVCGGDVTVHFQCLAPEDAAVIAALRRLVELSGGGKGLWLLRCLREAEVTEMRVIAQGEASELAAYLKDGTVFRDGILSIPVSRPGTVWLFGGGHVSQALAAVLTPLDFRAAVYDDRPEFASEERFPTAVRRISAPFEALRQHVSLGADDYLVIMTRGHQADFEVLRQTLRAPVRYLGCIGSRRKLALCKDRLLAEGFTEGEYARLHAPIGLAIGAETPEEIAVAIAAELIAVRAGKME